MTNRDERIMSSADLDRITELLTTAAFGFADIKEELRTNQVDSFVVTWDDTDWNRLTGVLDLFGRVNSRAAAAISNQIQRRIAAPSN